VPAGFEGGQMPLHMRLPKLRGFTNPFRTEYQVVNLDRLGQLYPDGGTVTVEDLVAKGAVRKGELVKVLGSGEPRRRADGQVHKYSGSPRRRSPPPAGPPRRCSVPGPTAPVPGRGGAPHRVPVRRPPLPESGHRLVAGC
jgi:hypothetical protein